jgi:quinol monooxygenase YgiN
MYKIIFLMAILVAFFTSQSTDAEGKSQVQTDENYTAIGSHHQLDNMMVRIAEIEIDSSYVAEYTAILKTEAEASIRLEPGVISIFPMSPKEDPTQVKLVEIYKDKEAYQSHLQSPHFKHYKTSTLHMVKSLKLVEMEALDKASMAKIFLKMK